MRTTLTLEDDAVALARKLGKRMTLGQAVSELVRRGASRPVPTTERHGLTLIKLAEQTTPVTVASVDELLDDLP
ncbi:MAG: hypothetical protein DMF81_21055 [Acidobacteria bacterium]|nr:MAG: hypothetical protein DMF81_21055 [Acidobacteriota bacterium]